MYGQDRWFGSRWGTVVGAALVLLVGSLVPSPLGRHPEFGTFGPDKFLHLLGHAGLTAALADALVAGRLDDREAAVVSVGLVTGYGLLIGRLQTRVPGRAPERADTAAGLVGSVLGVIGRRYVARDGQAARN